MPETVPILGGPRFALLGPAYARARPFTVNPVVRSIGIFMGGADAHDLTTTVLRACRERAGFTGPVEIATTQAYAHRDTLTVTAKRWPETHILSDLPDLSDFFARHDLQIGAGGGAVWERCRVGAPTLALIAAANQQATIPGLAALGAVAVPDPPTSLDESVVGEAIRSLLDDPVRRGQLSDRSRTLVDGLGAKRVALYLTADLLSVRPATVDDAEMIYSWRNHPATRDVSRNAGEIDWADHLQWLDRKLENPQCCLLIGRVGQTDVGVIRFDARGVGRSEISLYLDPALHGLRLGRAMLLAGEGDVLARRTTITQFVATVLDDNRGSMRLFESCGYRLQNGLWQKNVDPHFGTKAN